MEEHVDRQACKPSPVPDLRSVYAPPRRSFFPILGRGTAIYLPPPLPTGSSGQPGDGPGTHDPPIRPCSGWGLPGLRCYHRSGELLPRLFTLIPIHRDGPGVGRGLKPFSFQSRRFGTITYRLTDCPDIPIPMRDQIGESGGCGSQRSVTVRPEPVEGQRASVVRQAHPDKSGNIRSP